ncbi:UDP-glucosyltransferase 2-like [Leguminivora glycinivorella]|uniref:UDP-glucosyltransferase 2-like n=1 Tax=Leguminivora glycinivorella TaxID=1035111 RepID=UPI00200CC539|nr:UDP-glucosyltransferase 2-like [Leguminivora glycinivorella]
MRLSTSIILLSVLGWGCSYRILLVFPLPGVRSHSILGEGIVRHLLAAGHNVTYITAVPSKLSAPELRQIDVSSIKKVFHAEDFCDIDKVLGQGKEIEFHHLDILRRHLMVANYTATHKRVQELMMDPQEQFDLVILDWISTEFLAGLSPVLKCPFTWLSSMEPHGRVLSLVDEWPSPAYVPRSHSRATPPLTFAQRATELWNMLAIMYTKWQLMSEEQALYERAFGRAAAARGRRLPPLEAVKYNASLMLGNSHAATGLAIKLPQSYVPVAGFHIQEEPLPHNLLKIMDDAHDGVIYFSMGSLLKSRRMPDTLKQGLLAMFGSLRQTVIWKLEETPENVPKNVHIFSFVPQQSVLAHPNCILFITHGGQLSTTEALHFAVPILGVPVFGDQFRNIFRAVQKGFARHARAGLELPRDLKTEIQEMIGNPKYREVARELSLMYHDRRATGAELVQWVERVVRTRGAPHLRSPALLVPWYQKMYLDLMSLVVGVVLVIYFAVIRVLCMVKKIDLIKKNR